MGTTESIFADPEEIPSLPPPRQHELISSIHDDDNNHNNNRNSTGRSIRQAATQPTPSSLSSSQHHHRRRPRNTSVSSPQSIQPTTYPSNQTLPQINPTVPVRRKTSVFQLNGIVLGMSKSGKRTLLQRLEGKEPNFYNTNIATTRQSDENESAVTVVNAPYQPSIHLPKFNNDESIQLYVQAMRKVSTHNSSRNNSDHNHNKDHCHDYHFYVILINPRHDRVKVQKYITKRLHDILRLQGYDKKSSNDATTPIATSASYRPFCVSLLRNFADQIQDVLPESVDSIIQISDLTMWTMEVLGEYPHVMDHHTSIPPLLQCIDTSLLNCYGLSALHHFIYQSYVQNKQYDVQQELIRIEEAISISRQEATSFVVPYDEYIENVERLLQGSTASTSTTIPSSNNSAGSSIGRSTHRRNNDDHETTTSTTAHTTANTNRRRIINTQAPIRSLATSHPTSQRNEPNSLEQPRSRTMSGDTSTSTLPSVQQSIDHAKDALEAFLESDSDDRDEDGDQVKTTNGRESDNDDDEGFYLDETNDDNEENIEISPRETDPKLPNESQTTATVPNHVEESLPSITDSCANDHVDEIRNDTAEDDLQVNDDTVMTRIDNMDESAKLDVSPHLKETNDSGVSIIPSKSVEYDDDEESDFFVEEDVTENNESKIEALNDGTSREKDEPKAARPESDSVISVADENVSSSASLCDKNDAPTTPSDDVGSAINIDASDVSQKYVVDNMNSTPEPIVPNTNATVTSIPENEQISDAVRAALELARQDFERMMSEQDEQQQEEAQDKETLKDATPKKNKKEKHKKKSSAKEGKKTKRDDK